MKRTRATLGNRRDRKKLSKLKMSKFAKELSHIKNTLKSRDKEAERKKADIEWVLMSPAPLNPWSWNNASNSWQEVKPKIYADPDYPDFIDVLLKAKT